MNNTVKTVKASRVDKRTRSKRELGMDYEKTFATAWEKQLRDDIDKGYRYFYKQRGTTPPRVSKNIINY